MLPPCVAVSTDPPGPPGKMGGDARGVELLCPGVEDPLELLPASWGSGVSKWTVLSEGPVWWAQGVR